MDNSQNNSKFIDTSDGKEMWDVEGNIGQSPESAATINLTEDGMHTFSKFPESAVDQEEECETDTAELLNRKKNPVWSFAYYQELFDVDTSTVINRIQGSVIPLVSQSPTYIGGKPDIYGPFWVCATLVLFIGVCGNLTTLLNNWADSNYRYTAQFELLPVAAVIIYGYTFVMPLLVKLLFWWRKSSFHLSVSHIICTYGYSLFVYIPASVLFIVPNNIFDWIVVAIAIALSGTVILITLWPALREESKKTGILILAILFLLHAVMAVCLKMYFFSPAQQIASETVSNNFTSAISTRLTSSPENQKSS